MYTAEDLVFCGFYQNLLLLCSLQPSILPQQNLYMHKILPKYHVCRKEFLSEIAVKLQFKIIFIYIYIKMSTLTGVLTKLHIALNKSFLI